jgi:glutamate formiminotransferase / 5-formyltetrahydrofolate cyclo-ligase
VLECVVNISEGRRRSVVAAVAAVAGADLLDVHVDPDHNRAVLTLVGEEAPRTVAAAAVAQLDLGDHAGVHPRIGVVDVVPFVPLAGATFADAVAARDRCAAWIAGELGVPVFLYGPERTLPDVRRHAFRDLRPDAGPSGPHPTAGAVAVGARPLLVAWNAYLAEPDLARARAIAAAIRGPDLRALGLQVGDEVQVSLNLIAPDRVGPAEAWDRIAAHAPLARAELVGLAPRAVLARTPPGRWSQLDLAEGRTIEARLERRAASLRAPRGEGDGLSPSDHSGRAG